MNPPNVLWLETELDGLPRQHLARLNADDHWRPLCGAPGLGRVASRHDRSPICPACNEVLMKAVVAQ